jgi:hypothetical protein
MKNYTVKLKINAKNKKQIDNILNSLKKLNSEEHGIEITDQKIDEVVNKNTLQDEEVKAILKQIKNIPKEKTTICECCGKEAPVSKMDKLAKENLGIDLCGLNCFKSYYHGVK